MIGRLVASVLQHPRSAVLIWAVILVIAGLGALRSRVDFSSTAFFGDDAAEVARLSAFTQRWGPDDRTLIVVASGRGNDLLTPEALGEIERLAASLEAADAVAHVASLATSRPSAGGPTVGELVRTVPGAAERVREAPGVVPLLLSADGQHAAIVVELARSTDDLAEAVRAAAAVDAVLGQHRGTLETSTAGIPAVRAAFFGLTIRDQMVLGPIALLIAGAGLFFVLRRPIVLAAAAAGAGVPLVLLVGAMGWTGEPIGLLNQAYFTLLPVIAVADTIHLVVRTDEVRRERPEASGREVVVEAAGKVGWACLLTSLTTGIGFASLALTSMPILRSFGLYAGLGIAFAFATVILLVPLLLQGLSATPARPSRLRAVGRFAARRGPLVLLATLILAASAAWPATRVNVDNHLSGLLQPEHPVRRTGDLVDASLGGTLSLELELEDPNAFRIDEVRRWAHAQPETRAVVEPEPREGWARISVRVPDVGGKAFGAFAQRATTELGGDDLTVTGTTALAYAGVNRITTELRTSLLFVLAVVTVILAALLRRPLLAALTILPNVLPLWLGYAAVGLTGLELDPIGVVVLAVALGIAVDDTIHVTVRFVELRREGHNASEAAELAVAKTGRAVAITSVVLAAGLAVNAFSAFPPLAVLGTLGASVILFALLADLLVLPALLSRMR